MPELLELAALLCIAVFVGLIWPPLALLVAAAALLLVARALEVRRKGER